MPLVTAAAAILTIVGMAAAVGRRRCSRILAATAVVIGGIMLAALLVPGFSNVVAAAATLALLVPVAAVHLWTRARTRQPLSGWQKPAAGLAVVDIGFMALALLLMPAHPNMQAPAPGVMTGMSGMPGMSGHMPAMTAGGGVMTTLVLLGWAACAAVVVVPLIRRNRTGMVPHAACTGCMILAMALMAI